MLQHTIDKENEGGLLHVVVRVRHEGLRREAQVGVFDRELQDFAGQLGSKQQPKVVVDRRTDRRLHVGRVAAMLHMLHAKQESERANDLSWSIITGEGLPGERRTFLQEIEMPLLCSAYRVTMSRIRVYSSDGVLSARRRVATL